MSERARHPAARALRIAGAGVLFGAAAYATFEITAFVRSEDAQSRHAEPVQSESPPGEGAPATASREGPRPPSMRDRIQRAIAAAPVKEASQLEAFLTSAENEARRRGEVTAFDIEPGFLFAQDYAGPERAQAFSERMRALQRELAQRKAPDAGVRAAAGPAAAPPVVVTPAITPANIGEAMGRITTASGDEKRALIRQYLEVAYQLPEEDEQRRLTELNAAVGAKPPAVDLSAVDTLWARIQSTSDAGARGALVRQYFEAVGRLPEEEEKRRLEALNRLAPLPVAGGPAAVAGQPVREPDE